MYWHLHGIDVKTLFESLENGNEGDGKLLHGPKDSFKLHMIFNCRNSMFSGRGVAVSFIYQKQLLYSTNNIKAT